MAIRTKTFKWLKWPKMSKICRTMPIQISGQTLQDSVGSLRRQFSFVGVRTQSRLLLDRLDLFVGMGAGDVTRRNRFAAAAEKAASDERAAQTISLRERREIVKRKR